MDKHASIVFIAFFAVLSLISMPSPVSALSNLGEPCRFTGDCGEGFCLNAVCRFPQILEKISYNGTCRYTAECSQGFCKEGLCVIPSRDEFEIFTPGIKSGCAGVIENCTGIFCAICDTSWLLLFVSAAVAGFTARRRGRMLPVLLFIMPVLSGFLIFPILGFLLAVIEIFIIAILKRPVTIKIE